MDHISGYNIEEIIEETPTNLYRGKRDADQFPVIIKSALPNDIKAVTQLEHEYEISKHIDPEWGIKAITLEHNDDFITLVFENFNGESLDHYIKKNPIELNKFLKLAINIVSCISKMHEKGIIHKDINPASILVDLKTDEIRLIDFRIASLFKSEYIQALPNPSTIEGSLPYISPEQTGRMNRVVDSRSDLYSLGITLYEIITGHLPFSAKDPLEWVYCHIAQTPNSPHKVSPVIPKMISDIIMKLMSKVAEERYQTASGLKYDLEKCWKELKTHKEIKPFALGEKDISGKFQIIQKLYGRENELSTLLSSFEQISKTGTSELVLISGYSGIGKTALVNELHKPIVKEAGFFISGKFDQYKRGIPYYTIVEAFKGLIKNILFEPENKIIIWKQLITEALGINGQIIIDIIPQIELIIGKQPSLATVSSMEGHNRFTSVLEKFIQVFATREHPLTIFLDDLQWADSASLNLIKQLITNSENRYILLAGAYRDNEVNPSHPLMITLDEIKNQHPAITEITLHPLSQINVKQMIADSLNCELKVVDPLANLVYKKTGGNPFFLIQFLTTLYKENLLRFNSDTSYWEWKVNEIEAKGFTDNVVDLMTGIIKQLSVSTQNMLKLAACIGNKFDKHILSIISSQTEKEVIETLRPFVEEGFLISYQGNYEFLHDRVQQAAYSLQSEIEKSKTHCKIGKLLIKSTPEKELEENVFVIVNHLSQSPDCLSDLPTKINAAGLNLLAAKKAKASIAYQSAIEYLDSGIALLFENEWENNYELMFNLLIEKAECEFLTGNHEDAIGLLDLLLKKADSKIRMASVYRLKMQAHMIRSEANETINSAVECLKLFNIIISAHPSAEDVMKELDEINKKIRNRKIEELINLPLMTDPEIIAVMGMLSELYAAAYTSDPNLFFLHLARLVNLSLEYGNTDASVLAYGGFGFVLQVGFNKFKEGQQYAELGFNLVEKNKFETFRAKGTYFLSLTSFWNKHVITSKDLLNKAFQEAIDVGDLPLACYCCLIQSFILVYEGRDLVKVNNQLEKLVYFTRKANYAAMEAFVTSQKQFVHTMQGRTDNLSTYNSKDFDAGLFEEQMDKHIPTVSCWYYITKMQVGFISINPGETIIAAEKAKIFFAAAVGSLPMADFNYYYALALAAIYSDATSGEKTIYQETLKQCQEFLKERADNCPENFYNRYALVSAEICKTKGENENAMKWYDEAIKSAKENGFKQNEAISYELASKYYENTGNKVIAESYIREARDHYSIWGAKGKVDQIEKNYPSLKEQQPIKAPDGIGGIALKELDLHTIIKASQAISSPLEINELTESLIRIMMEQAGAIKGVLLLEQNNELTIAAEAILNGEISVKTYDIFKPVQADLVPEKIIHYVQRTKETVILDYASKNNTFNTDKYVETNHIKSIISLPIIKQAKLIGILYLENNLFAGAFSADKIDVLELLASQAAISIENVTFLAELKKSETRLRLAMTQLPAVIWTLDKDLRFTSSQGNLLKKFGVENDTSVGKTLYEYFQTTDSDFLPIASHLKVLKGESVKYQSEIMGYIWESYVEPLKNSKGEIIGCIGMAMDITERKNAEEKIQESEARFRRFAEINNEGVVIHDNGIIKEVNPAFAKMFGYEEAEVIGMTPFQFTPVELVGLLKKNMLELTTEPFETVGLRKDGSTFYTELQGRIINYQGKSLSVVTIRDVTSRKNAEGKLRESEERFRLLAETSSIIPWESDAKTFQFTYVGPQAETILGYPAKDWYTQDFWPNHIHLDDRKEALFYCVESYKNKKNYEFEYRMVAANGNVVWFHDIVNVVMENDEPVLLRGFLIDITKNKIAEEKVQKLNTELEHAVIELKESENKLKEAQKIGAMGSWEWDIKKNKIEWSDESYRIFGVEPNGFSSDYESYLKLIHPDDVEKVSHAIERALKKKTFFEFDHRIIRKDGTERIIHSNGKLICDAKNEPIKMHGIAHDVTEMKQAELEIKKFNSELEQRVKERTEELEIANKDLESFAYSVTHDLKAPLRSIIGFNELIMKKHSKLFNEDALGLFNIVQSNAKKMNGLISDLLEFSKLGRKEIEKKDLNMNEVVKEALAGVHNANPQYKAEVILHPLPNSMADPGLINIVFTNLLTNAFKYSSEKPQPVIEIGGYEDEDKNIYFIKDNGAGFDMKYVDKLFIVFSRLHSDFEFEGTGIGLATVFKIITKHKGKIWAEAEESKGATFYFSLPK